MFECAVYVLVLIYMCVRGLESEKYDACVLVIYNSGFVCGVDSYLLL